MCGIIRSDTPPSGTNCAVMLHPCLSSALQSRSRHTAGAPLAPGWPATQPQRGGPADTDQNSSFMSERADVTITHRGPATRHPRRAHMTGDTPPPAPPPPPPPPLAMRGTGGGDRQLWRDGADCGAATGPPRSAAGPLSSTTIHSGQRSDASPPPARDFLLCFLRARPPP